jgi:hypothetical protein
MESEIDGLFFNDHHHHHHHYTPLQVPECRTRLNPSRHHIFKYIILPVDDNSKFRCWYLYLYQTLVVFCFFFASRVNLNRPLRKGDGCLRFMASEQSVTDYLYVIQT